MHQDHTDSPALTPFELTYSPAYRPSGSPIDPHASRQALQERCTAVVDAIDADGAIASFERESGRMVTGCKRVQFVNGLAHSAATWLATGVPA